MIKKKEKELSKFSLIDQMAMGGIHGGAGYTFQDRYIVCHIPRWLSDPNFSRLMSEATGDVDVVFKEEANEYYIHIQVKDHQVTLSEFKQVISAFERINSGTNNVYRKFILTAPVLAARLRPLLTALERFKNADKFYDNENRAALATTKEALLVILDELGLRLHEEFLLNRMEFEIGKFDLNDNGTCKKIFVTGLMEHEKYKQHLFDVLYPAYSTLIDEVLAHRGKVMSSVQIEALILAALSLEKNAKPSNVLHVHNWTLEKYEPQATVEIDWSSRFDRLSRKVPDSQVWDGELIPELYQRRAEILNATANRHIVFRGKCSLSTGIALGAAFPQAGNWTFELNQPPLSAPWFSDAERQKKYKVRFKVVDPLSLGLSVNDEDIVFVFNITGTAHDEVVKYFKDNHLAIKKIILVEPNKKPGNSSLQSDSEAVSLASSSKDILRQMLIKFKSTKTHLFYFGPIGLSIFLGQQLTSVGQIQLYEFQDPGYKPTCLIKT